MKNPLPIPLSIAVAEIIEHKTRLNRRPRYVKSLRQYLLAFIRGRESLCISTIDELVIEDWFTARKEPPVSRAGNVGKLSALFAHAFRRRWINENPCRRIEKVSIEQKVPVIFSVTQCERLLQSCSDSALAYLVLTLLAGIRPDEVGRLDWTAVNFESGVVTVAAAASKVRRRRIVHLMPSAVAWLKLAKARNAQLPSSIWERKKFVHHFQHTLSLPRWPQDVLRHTCASYWLAHTRDAGKVAFELGNSPSILLRHYREIVSAPDAAAFWSIQPCTTGVHGVQQQNHEK